MLKFNVLTTAAMAALAAGIVIAQPAVAATQTVTSLGLPVPAGTAWGSLPGENTGGGDAYISSAAPRSGNGSLELVGDRTRVQTGYQYGGPGVATNLGLLSDVLSLVFDWQVAADSARQTYTPALRLMVQDGAQRSELIWEGAYNPGVGGLASANPTGAWYRTNSTDVFWQFATGLGPNEDGGMLQLHTITDWAASNYYSDAAYVTAISVGAGSGATLGYHAFVDNVTFTTTGGSTTYNFEMQAPVPEPATWAMMIGGLGLVGASMRRRSTKVQFA
ncbi:hypothetical protein SLG_13290 [Sphingobium sp. SYK-6]|uniref:PEPxxWA-CTERM sorting domain-containing protein n=1 Tax=Sphingobium sp. (strain NBRC 103272 / SYK-6) TaxID=627192 RepID=UPI00022773B1|nr:PEPxxWA-CTERM sorting domain-containing protein [Sphingobium sp. SYK-6]BAK66004.1 hypothetical protein SLG_13290 [Sphingobium sp. SYK-6]